MNNITWGHVLLVSLLAVGGQYLLKAKSPEPTPAVVVPEYQVSPELQRVVAPLSESLAGQPEDAKRLEGLLAAMADTIERDGTDRKLIGDMEKLQRFVDSTFAAAMQDTQLKGRYKLSAVQDAIKVNLGISQFDPVAIDDVMRRHIVEAFRAGAWACREAR